MPTVARHKEKLVISLLQTRFVVKLTEFLSVSKVNKSCEKGQIMWEVVKVPMTGIFFLLSCSKELLK